MTDLEAGLRNSLKHNLDPIDATLHLPDGVASKARSRRFITMLSMGMAAVLLAAVTVWTTSELSSNPSQPPVAPPVSGSPEDNANEGSTAELVVGSIEEVGDVVGIALRAIDLETGESRKLQVSDFAPGDAQFALARMGTQFVFRCSAGACALDRDLQGEPRTLGEAWCWAPSATEGRVWLALLDPDSPATVRSMKSVREVSLDGQVSVDSELPPDRWHCPVGAVDQGVLFQEEDDLVVWDAEAGEVVFRLPGPFPADTHGELVA